MKISEVTKQKNLSEDASGGGTSSGSVATSMGGGDGFGKSIFMKDEVDEAAPKRKTKTNMRKR
jgi:hypothetical protein